MQFLNQASRLICTIYISSRSSDEYLVPVIVGLITMSIMSIVFLIIARNYAKSRQYQDKDKPLQAIQGAKVVEKKDGEGYAATKYTLDLREGGRIVLQAYQPELKKLVLGDIVDITYRGETMESVQFSSRNGGKA